MDMALLNKVEHLFRIDRKGTAVVWLQDEASHVGKEGMGHGPFMLIDVNPPEGFYRTSCRTPLAEGEDQYELGAKDRDQSLAKLALKVLPISVVFRRQIEAQNAPEDIEGSTTTGELTQPRRNSEAVSFIDLLVLK
jgi:hypothetical protein